MGKYVELKVFHINLWRESSDREALRDLAIATAEADAVSINEGRLHVDDVREFCKAHPEFVFFTAKDAKSDPTPNEMNNILILRKKTFKVGTHAVSTEQMCKKTAGTPDRHMLTVRVDHIKSGRKMRFRVTHMNSHVENKSWHRLPRFPQYLEHQRNLNQVMSRKTRIIDILCMDCNVNYRRKFVREFPAYPYKALLKRGVTNNWRELGMTKNGTHHARLIDAVFSRKGNVLRWVRQRVFQNMRSDHNGLLVTLEILAVDV